MGTKSKSFALVIVALFLISLVVVPPATVKAQSKTITVPNDYPTIASAIENASNGDTILVKNGTYEENAIKTTKNISIIGEGYQPTIVYLTSLSHEIVIDVLGHTATFFDPAMTINANDFVLSGLTIKSNGGDISLNGNGIQVTANKIETTFGMSGSNLYVAGNIFSKVGFSANYSRITKNTITGGICLSGEYTIFSSNSITNEAPSVSTNNCLITDNNISNAPYAIFPLYGNSNVFSDNVIDHLSFGLWVRGSNNTIIKNQITRCGVALQPNPNNTYYGNTIANNLWGVDTVGSLLNPDGNSVTFYKNNMKDNTYQVNTLFNSKQDYFDDGKEGNYWSDYRGSDSNGDGIGDTPYVIDGNRLDRYPLIAPVNISSIPDLIPEWALAPSIEVISPTSSSYSNGNITLTFSINKQPTLMNYNLDGLRNTTITGNLTLTNISSGTHNVTIYASDSYRNMGVSSTIIFVVEKQMIENLGSPIAVAIIIVSVAIVCVIVGLMFFRRHRKTIKLS